MARSVTGDRFTATQSRTAQSPDRSAVILLLIHLPRAIKFGASIIFFYIKAIVQKHQSQKIRSRGVMKNSLLPFFILLLLSLCTTGLAQDNPHGPLSDYTYLHKHQDLAIGSNSDNSSREVDVQFFPGRGDSLIFGPVYTRSESLANTGNGLTEMIAGNFTGDSRDEVATVWECGNRSVALAFSNIDRLTGEWTDLNVTRSDSLALIDLGFPEDSAWIYSFYKYRLLRLEKGNFDLDDRDELVLAYWGADSTIHIELYDDSFGLTHPRAMIADQHLWAHPLVPRSDDVYDMMYFDIAVEDFDNDGISEVLLIAKDGTAEPSAKLFAAVYDYNPETAAFTLTTKTDVPHGITLGWYERCRHLYTTVGRMNAARKGDGFLSVYFTDPDLQHVYTFLPFDISNDLSGITFGTPTQEYGCVMSLVSSDINNDGFDETIAVRQWDALIEQHYHWGDTLFVLTLDTTLTIHRTLATRGASFSGNPTDRVYFEILGRRTVTIGDVDSDTSAASWLPELGIGQACWPQGQNPVYGLCVYNFTRDTAGNVTGLQLRVKKDGYPPEKIIAGNFDGGNIRLGLPGHFFKTDIYQPIVILNAPPVHFDVFDTTKYDICHSFPDSSDFYSRYEKKSESSVEVQTKVSECWAMSETFGGELSYLGLGASLSFEQRYGKDFSKMDGSSRTITITQTVDAISEDEIFATVIDYDIWEYPVFMEDSLIGHILVMDPLNVSNQWFPSKSWSAASYIPNHEVGNILSYQRYPSLSNNENVAALISGTYDNSYTLHASSSYSWDFQFQDFVNSQTETTNKIGLDVGVGASFFGISFAGKDTYNRENVSTHKTSVTQDLKISAHLDAVDLGLGEVRYTVTPYSYWAKNGALVIDYAVQPELAPPGFTPTWWQQHYDSIPDPAFILPWRLDPEKGIKITENAKRYQTNSIIFSKNDPVAGDTIIIRAQIYNFSLSPTLGTVNVRFYVGDPDSGGTPIIGLNGETELTTGSFIKSRENTSVQMQWQIPASLPSYPRIYAVIDPGDEIREIHENNNKGFTVLGKTQSPPDNVREDEITLIPSKFALKQNYPNPFNPTTTFQFSIPVSQMTTLKVYDILGREIATLVNEVKSPGTYSVQWDASKLSSGVYMYTLRSGNEFQSKKLVLLK
jgi:hypothetical protein